MPDFSVTVENHNGKQYIINSEIKKLHKKKKYIKMKRIILSALAICCATLWAAEKPKRTPWYKEISYPCSYDNSQQKALVYFAKSKSPRPLVVVLHTWSQSYKEAYIYASPAVKYDFHIIMPNFRGPNTRSNPESMGSDAAVADIVDAVKWMKTQANVDENRIYLIGGSGGGHMALLMAGRHPEIWAGVSAWCPISDIKAWCQFHKGKGYGSHIIKNLKGDPRTDEAAAKEAAKRSPVTYLANAKNVTLDISTGIHDGYRGSVPVTETLYAFNKVVGAKNAIPAEHIFSLRNKRQAPAGTPQFTDPGYGKRKIHYRKISGNTRVTIFEGGHDILIGYGFSWLAKQKKGTPAVWDNSDGDSKSVQLTK